MSTKRRPKHGRRTYFPRVALYTGCALAFASLVVGWTASAHRATAPAARSDQATTIGSRYSPQRTGLPVLAPAPSATEASLQLQALLGQHTVLAADMMRGRLRGDPDLAQAANEALGRNTDAMGQLVGALFGDQARSQFVRYWAAHVSALFNYARGLADHDDAVRAQAQSVIVTFEGNLAQFFSVASQGRLGLAAAQDAVRTHITHLLQQADAYAAKNYALSDQIYREAYAHAFGLGKVLASTLLPPGVATILDSPTWQLRSQLDQLLGEHVVLVVSAMRSGVTNSADFTAAADSLNGNTGDLGGAIATLFGPAAGRRFQTLWADHVDALIAYAGAAEKHDDAQRAAAQTKLAGFEQRFAAFLGGATNNKMTSGALARALQGHDQMLVREVDAYLGKDYRQAHDLAYSTYQDMVGLAGQLSNAFTATLTSRVPLGGVQTGRGGMAATLQRRWHGG